MDKTTHTKKEIVANVMSKAKEGKKTIEGIIYYDVGFRTYVFTVELKSILYFMSSHGLEHCTDIMKDITYFKCTKSGKLETQVLPQPEWV